MSERRVEFTPLALIESAPRNPKRHASDAINRSIQRFGFAELPLIDERTGRLVAGHGRLDQLYAMRKAGQEPPDGVQVDASGEWLVPVVRGWASRSDADAEAYVVASNRLTTLGGWDDEQLGELLSDLQEVDPELLGIAGYTEEDLAGLLGGDRTDLPPGSGDADDAPEPPPEPKSRLGDVWLLGPHRVRCGDSTDPLVWDSILGGDRPAVVFTDPPYGIKYKLHLDSDRAKRNDFIENDATPDEALRVTRDALALFHDAQAHFVCCDWRSLSTIIDAMLAAAIEPKACIVWDKQSRVQNLDRYAKQHEFIVYAGPYGGQPTECTDVWVHPRDFEPDHPTPKPVSLIEQALTTASEPEDLVADAFGGSGSTLIAAHRTGRVARVVELDPRYVDVICRRYQEHVGEKPILESTGEAHDFTSHP